MKSVRYHIEYGLLKGAVNTSGYLASNTRMIVTNKVDRRGHKVQIVPTNALLLLNMFLYYNTMLQHVSIPVGIIFRDTSKS
jgi:hypothetical protein